MKMIFIFIDGWGIGHDDKEINPFLVADTSNIDMIFRESKIYPTDTTLGIEGLPQSATGQTTIFTGVNASRVLGRHMSGQPTITLKKIIRENNLFMELIRRGCKVTNSNVYRTEYLEKLLYDKDRKFRPSVTTVMNHAAGLEFRSVNDYIREKGIYHDITGKILLESGYEVEERTPEEAAEVLYNISREYDFTLFEHFMSDIIGHGMDMRQAVLEIELLDRFLGRLAGLANLDEDIIFITSDHGNIEDVSVKTHTMNEVSTIVMGRKINHVDIRIDSLVDIMPTILKIFDD